MLALKSKYRCAFVQLCRSAGTSVDFLLLIVCMWRCHVAPGGFNGFMLLTEKSKLQMEDKLKSDFKKIFSMTQRLVVQTTSCWRR